MKLHESAEVKCPFYCQEDEHRICCEGVTQRSRTHIVFGGSNLKQEYERRYCWQDYEKCLVYNMLMSKYEEGKSE
jgi:hypothetical protein